MSGVLGAAEGETPSETTARIEEAKKGATDLTGLVKRKKIDGDKASSGKRKADDDAEDETKSGEAKKAKVEEVAEE